MLKKRLQTQAFKSIGMWLIMWFWRMGNASAILEHLVITTFFDNLWVIIKKVKNLLKLKKL